VNLAVLARLARSGALPRLPFLQSRRGPLGDPDHVYYHGISEGGCQGVTALALSPDIEKGALNVPCGFWTMFFSRSSDFHLARHAVQVFYPGALERQELLVLTQLLWDYTDPANYAAHVLRDPLPGSTTKALLYQEAINDASVPNVTTRAMVRELGLKLASPFVERVEGVDLAGAPLGSAYAQFDLGVRPRLGRDNVPPSPSSVHEEARSLEAVRAQLRRFFRGDGLVGEDPLAIRSPAGSDQDPKTSAGSK
jgi:hypothetical protein